MNKIPLWMWGFIIIVAGVFAGQMTPADSDGAQLGKGIVTLIAVVIGVTIMVASAVRAILRKRKGYSR